MHHIWMIALVALLVACGKTPETPLAPPTSAASAVPTTAAPSAAPAAAPAAAPPSAPADRQAPPPAAPNDGQGPGPAPAPGPGPANPYAWGWIGLQLSDLPDDLRARARVPQGGALVKGFADGSPAKDVLQPEDILLRIDDVEIASIPEFLTGIRERAPGSEVHLTILRGGKEAVAILRIGERRAKDALSAAVASARDWLVQQQQKDGAWEFPHPITMDGKPTGKPHCAVTALVLAALAGLPPEARAAADAPLEKGIRFLQGRVTKDGLVDAPLEEGVAYRSYATALYAIALARRHGGGDKEILDRLVAGLKKSQMAEPRGLSPLDWMYGSWNTYDGEVEYTTRGDISCTSYVLQALYEAGVPADDPAVMKAHRFVKKSQNVSESGPGFPELDDAGFAFNPRTGKAGFKEISSNQVRNYSYGSTTADGLRSLFYCVRKKDDPRVGGALAWLLRNYSVHKNPGFDRSGQPPAVRFDRGIYFYYLHSMAEGFAAAAPGETVLVSGGDRTWAVDIVGELCSMQRKDGLWRNPENVMHEDDPNVATALCLLTLDVCARHLK